MRIRTNSRAIFPIWKMLTLPFSGWKEIAAQSERLQISQGLVDCGGAEWTDMNKILNIH